MTWKPLLRNHVLLRFLSWIASLHIRLCFASGRWRTLGVEAPGKLWAEGKPFILCFWHGRLLMMPYCWKRGVPIHVLISQHQDGQLLAHTVSHFGIDTIAGSTSRGGTAALRAMVKALREGECIGITPDGPRGPRMRAASGIVQVARLAGVPILPVTYAVSRRRVLKSWDRFVLAWPFARGVVIWGEPVHVARDADQAAIEATRRRVEESLNAITREADRMMDHEPIVPAPDETGDAGAEQPAGEN